MVNSVRITPNGLTSLVSEEQECRDKGDRIYDCRALQVPEFWEHDKKFRLTMSFPDLSEDKDKFNPIATAVLSRLRSPSGWSTDLICGTAFLYNDTEDDIVDFNLEEFNYIWGKMNADDRARKWKRTENLVDSGCQPTQAPATTTAKAKAKSKSKGRATKARA